MHQTDTQGELVTPTGASTLAAQKTKEKLPLKYKVLKIGMESGKRNYQTSGILRAMIIEEKNKKGRDKMEKAKVYFCKTSLGF